jgi:hypothetical protein
MERKKLIEKPESPLLSCPRLGCDCPLEKMIFLEPSKLYRCSPEGHQETGKAFFLD